MLDHTDSRQFTRFEESGEISYQFPDSEQSYSGTCLNMSGAGILFRAEHFIDNGRALEVKIASHSSLTISMVAYMEVIRSNEVEPGVYEVATEIKGIKEI